MKRWEAWVNHAAWSLVALSGLVYGVLKYFLTSSDPDSRLGHPWQPFVLAVHLVAAPIAIFALGLVFRRHALKRLTTGEPERRRTGIVMTLLAIPLALSGSVVQVLTGDAARRWTGWAHAALGLVYAVGYALHPLVSGLPDDAAESPTKSENGVS